MVWPWGHGHTVRRPRAARDRDGCRPDTETPDILLCDALCLRCSGYMCRLEMTSWFMSDLEAPAGRCADLAYVIVADDIAARTASGELPPGRGCLPSGNWLATMAWRTALSAGP